MYAEADYFDSDARHSLPAQLDGSSSQAPMNLVVDENLRFAGYSNIDFSDNCYPASGDCVPATAGANLHDQMFFNHEHEYKRHLMEATLQDSSQSQLMQQPNNWDVDGVPQDHFPIHSSHHFHGQQHSDLEQQDINLQCCNSTPYQPLSYSGSDFLNLLQLPRGSVPSVLPATLPFNSSNKKPGNYNSLDIYADLQAQNEVTSGSAFLYDSPLHLNFPPQHPMFRDLLQSLPYGGSVGGSYFGGIDEGEGNGGVLQEGENSVFDFRREIGGLGRGEARGANNFATEKHRREQLNEKYKALRLLIPNTTKPDRASIVADAIEYIKELQRRADELQILVDRKRCGRQRSKRLKPDEEAAADVESSSIKPNDREHSYSLRSSWLVRKSKDTVVDVRIIDDEVIIKLTQRKKMNCLLVVAKILHELDLSLLHVAGGNIGAFYIFMFNTKINEGSSVYASAIAKRMIEALDWQCPPLNTAL